MKKENNQKTLIFGTVGGIGDRLFCMAYGLRLARLMKRKPIFWWPKTNECDAEFKELFEPQKDLEIIDRTEKDIQAKEGAYFSKENVERDNLENFYYIKPEKNQKPILINLPSAYCLAKEREFLKNLDYKKSIKEEVSRTIRKLKPIKELDEKINTFPKRFDENTISLHLRRTDLKNWLLDKLPKDKEICKKLKEYAKENPEIKFFLATDSKKTESRFKKELKDRIITYPKENWVEKEDKNRGWRENIYRPKESVRESLIELYLLSKNKSFIRFEEYSGNFNKLPPVLNPNQNIIIFKFEKSILGKYGFKRLKVLIRESLNRLDLSIGKIGISLRTNHPRLYSQLKGLKENE